MPAPEGGLLDRVDVVDANVCRSAAKCARSRGVALPTFSQLIGAAPIPASILDRLQSVDPDAAEPLNLWRVNWFNSHDRRGRQEVSAYVVLPRRLNYLFNTPESRHLLAYRLGMKGDDLSFLDEIGISSIANIIASIKPAKYMNYGPHDVVMTITTDGASRYSSEMGAVGCGEFSGGVPEADVEHLLVTGLHESIADSLIEMMARERCRVFNLGYDIWVEQQGVGLSDFDARHNQSFWRAAADAASAWDELITEFGLN